MAKDPVTMLAKVPLFEDLAKKDLKVIQQAAREVEFPSGRTIVQEGTSGVAFHLILSGNAAVKVGGRTKATLGPGDYFGEISLIDRGPRSATVVATTDVRTLSVASWNFMQIIDSTPTVGRKLLVGLCRRIREVEKGAYHH